MTKFIYSYYYLFIQQKDEIFKSTNNIIYIENNYYSRQF